MGEPDRGQSELVGFTLIFGLILFVLVLVISVGAVGLVNTQDHQRSTNAQQAFVVLADNVDAVTLAGAPSRSTEVRLADATLSFGETETITIRVEPVAGGDFTEFNVTTRPIVYDTGTSTSLRYSSGMLIRVDEPDAVLFREPRFVLTEESVILPVVRTHSVEEGTVAVGGSPVVDIRTTREGIDDRWVSDAGHSVSLEVTSPYSSVWYQYLAGNPDADCTHTGDTVTCHLETNRVSVTVYSVSVLFQ